MLGYCAFWASFAGLYDFVHQYGSSQMWCSDIHSGFFLTTVPGFRSYHYIPAEYLVLLPTEKTVFVNVCVTLCRYPYKYTHTTLCGCVCISVCVYTLQSLSFPMVSYAPAVI